MKTLLASVVAVVGILGGVPPAGAQPAPAKTASAVDVQFQLADRDLSQAEGLVSAIEASVKETVKAASMTDRQVVEDCLANFSIDQSYDDMVKMKKNWSQPVKGTLGITMEFYYEAKAHASGDMSNCDRLKNLPWGRMNGQSFDDADQCRSDYETVELVRTFLNRSPKFVEHCQKLLGAPSAESAALCQDVLQKPFGFSPLCDKMASFKSMRGGEAFDCKGFFRALNGDEAGCHPPEKTVIYDMPPYQMTHYCVSIPKFYQVKKAKNPELCGNDYGCLIATGRAAEVAGGLERAIRGQYCSMFPKLSPRPTMAEAVVTYQNKGATVSTLLDSSHARLAAIDAAMTYYDEKLFSAIDSREEKIARLRDYYRRLDRKYRLPATGPVPQPAAKQG